MYGKLPKAGLIIYSYVYKVILITIDDFVY